MKHDKVRINLRVFNVNQFESLDEALGVLPMELIMLWINTGWRNTQAVKIADAMKVRR